MIKQNLSQRPYLVEALTHIIGWGIVFGFPFLMMSRSGFNITWTSYLRHGCIVPPFVSHYFLPKLLSAHPSVFI